MRDHVSITVGDLPRAARFYDAVMAALGVPCVNCSEAVHHRAPAG
jgi:catechol 2,3-dioxygenase-like lactoylglutathione lyase family enzyme